MARPSNNQRGEATETIRRLCNAHGIKEGCRRAREQFPGVPRGTWGRWRVEAVGTAPDQDDRERSARAKVEREVRRSIPPVGELLPASADVVPATRRALDFWRMLQELDDDAALMRAYAVAQATDGTRKLRVPSALLSAHKMRSDLIRLAIQHAEVAWSTERNRKFQEAVMGAVGDVSKEVQARVIERLRTLRDENEELFGV